MTYKTFLSALFGCAAVGLAVLHYVNHGDRIPESRELLFMGGLALASAFLADAGEVGSFVKALWPFPHGKHDGGDEA